jgi:DNA-binding NarL/FixJ family response regulator
MKPSSVRNKPRSASILLADDHDVVRKGLRTMLEAQEGWHVCGEAANGREAVRLAAELRPRVAVLDLEMTELDGLQATRRIKKDNPDIEVLIFTMHDAEYLIREALLAGARAFVLKSEGGRTLIDAISAVLEHKPFFASRVSESLLNSFLKSRGGGDDNSPLTYRECEIVHLLATGKSNKEAAMALGISVKTIETHRAAVMRKLGFSSIVELVRYAIRERIIKA